MDMITDNQTKENIPYYKIAKELLIKIHGYSKEEAQKFIEESDYNEIENIVNAEFLTRYAIKSISQSLLDLSLGLYTSNEISQLKDSIFNGSANDQIYKKLISDKLWNAGHYTTNSTQYYNLILDILSYMHNGWAKKNSQQFFTTYKEREQQYKFLRSELIGWDNIENYTIFLKPILEKAELPINELYLKQCYNNRVKDFFEKNNINSMNDLLENIMHNSFDEHVFLAFYLDFSSAVCPHDVKSEELIHKEILQNSELAMLILKQIQKYGIGKLNTEFTNKFFNVSPNPNRKEAEIKISEYEKEIQALEERIKQLNFDIDNIKNSNPYYIKNSDNMQEEQDSQQR